MGDSSVRVGKMQVRACPDKHYMPTYTHTNTLMHAQTNIDDVPVTGNGKCDDGLRQRGDERSRYHQQ